MYTYELYDVLFLIQSLQNPDPGFPFTKYLSLLTAATRSGLNSKLTYQSSSYTNPHHHHSYFCRIWSAFGMPSLLLTFLFHYPQSSTISHSFCGHTFTTTLTHADRAHFIWCFHVTGVPNHIIPLILVNKIKLWFCFFFSSFLFISVFFGGSQWAYWDTSALYHFSVVSLSTNSITLFLCCKTWNKVKWK